MGCLRLRGPARAIVHSSAYLRILVHSPDIEDQEGPTGCHTSEGPHAPYTCPWSVVCPNMVLGLESVWNSVPGSELRDI